MAQLVFDNTGAVAVMVIRCDTIRGWGSTVCTSSSETADADCTIALDPSVVPYRGRKRQYISCLHIQIIKSVNIQRILGFSLLIFFNFSPQQVFLLRFKFLSILTPEIETCSFGFQVRSSQCWNWNLPYHKFWEVSRSLKVTLKIFTCVLTLFWKVTLGWRWSCKSGRRWYLQTKEWINFKNIPKTWTL